MLTQKKCVPCEGGVTALPPDSIQKLLPDIPGWELTSGNKSIRRRFTFNDFAAALEFVNKVGAIAENEGHHPDIAFGWGYAEIVLWTHAIGGLHLNDFIVASKINALNGK